MNSLSPLLQELRRKISSFPQEDAFLLNNSSFSFQSENFSPLLPANSSEKTIAFIDGGQAELLVAANFCVSFIRVAAVVMQGQNKIKHEKEEFFLLTTTKNCEGELWYESKIFSEGNFSLLSESNLFVSSQDAHLKSGIERAPIFKVTSMARRFAELALAAKIAPQADFILLDGTLQKTFPNEETYIQNIAKNTCALAKSSSLCTASGNSPVLFLKKNAPAGSWRYTVNKHTSFVKLQEKSKHIFRYEGTPEILPHLLHQSCDATFLGYPYGLILADKLARVSNEEKRVLQARFLLDKENKDILEYLFTTDAHGILDQNG